MGNGRWFGGGMKVCPGARPTDGILDVTVIGDVGLWDFVRMGKKMYDGTIGEIPGVTCLRAKRVEASPAGDDRTPVLVELEGESAGRLPATFTLHAAALPVVAELR
jgi:diacylglycerol kinase (ATP)